MTPMLEDNALEQCAQQMSFAMPSGKPIEPRPKLRALSGAEQEGMEVGIVALRRDAGDGLVDMVEGRVPVGAAFDEFTHVPLQIRGGSRAGFDVRVAAEPKLATMNRSELTKGLSDKT